MDKLIQDIVSVDHSCAKAVEEAKKKKQDVSLNMNDKKKEIYDDFVAQYQKTLDEKKSELSAKIAETKKKADDEYEVSLNKLSELYKLHKDEWIDAIVERCKDLS